MQPTTMQIVTEGEVVAHTYKGDNHFKSSDKKKEDTNLTTEDADHGFIEIGHFRDLPGIKRHSSSLGFVSEPAFNQEEYEKVTLVKKECEAMAVAKK